jgi:hypothetical protein
MTPSQPEVTTQMVFVHGTEGLSGDVIVEDADPITIINTPRRWQSVAEEVLAGEAMAVLGV